MNGDWIGTAQKRKGDKLSAELEDIITLLEANRTYQATLKDGQRITVGGGESEVRYAEPSEIETDGEVYDRLGWAYNALALLLL